MSEQVLDTDLTAYPAETPEVPETAETPDAPEESAAPELPEEISDADLPKPEPQTACDAACDDRILEKLDQMEEQLSAQPSAAQIDRISSRLDEMDARISSLRRLADMHQEIEKQLNDEINAHKENFYRRIVNPILVEFFEIQEDINAEAMDAEPETAALLQRFVSAISRTLAHYGVTVETVAVGDAYDAKIHNAVKAIPTDDPALDKTIAKTRQSLVHLIDGQITERARVQVYQYQPAEKPAEQ